MKAQKSKGEVKTMIRRQLVLGVIGAIFFFICNTLFAENTSTTTPEMTQQKLERSVIRQFDYIDKRLLSGTNTQTIIESRNTEAIEILERARASKDEIAKQIKDREYKNAILALRKLNTAINKAIKMSRSEDKAVKKIKDDMETAHIINDSFFARAKKWGIDKGDTGEEAQTLIQKAVKKRSQAEQDFKAALDGFHASTRLLKKAVAAARRWNIAHHKEPEETEE
ncbi:MAG: hypothetical protein ABUK13_08275 [Gammaproteobacteria bacterium]